MTQLQHRLYVADGNGNNSM